jgi:hypothetical protein
VCWFSPDELQPLFSRCFDIIRDSRFPIPNPSVLMASTMSELLPNLAARLFDPAGHHKLVAVQDALRHFQQ